MPIKILIAHYEPRVRAELKEKVESWGYWVEVVGDGSALIHSIDRVNPDLVLVYAPLPKLNAPEAVQRLRKDGKWRNIPIIVFSDIYKGKKFSDDMQRVGATEFLEWPCEEDKIKSLLERHTSRVSEPRVTPKEEQPTVITKAPSLSKDKGALDDEIEKKLAETLSGIKIPKVKKKKSSEQLPTLEPPSFRAAPPAEPAPVQAAPETGAPGAEEPTTSLMTAEDLFSDVLSEIEKNLPDLESADETPLVRESENLAETQAIDATDLKNKIDQIIETTLSGEEKISVGVAPQPSAHKEAETSLFEVQEKPEEESERMGGTGREEEVTPADSSGVETVMLQTPAGLTFHESVSEEPFSVSEEAPKAVEEPLHPPEVESQPEEPLTPSVQTVEFESFIRPEEGPETVTISTDELRKVGYEGIPFGPYILMERIATGGMAELFKAKKKGVEGFEKVVAIKRILPHLSGNEEFITMFIDEAKVVAGLTHPNIVQIFDLGRIGHDYYIAMEYVEGKDLRTVMKKAREREQTLPIPVACLIASRLLAALDYAHRAKDSAGRFLNIVHRDVSPQNVLISYDGDIKLTDFGVAKAAIKAHQTVSGALKGKLLYMSPEQAWGKPVDHRSDIFSVAVILYELLAGVTLFYQKGDNEVAVLEKVRQAKIPDIKQYVTNIPDRLVKILQKAFEKDPNERYQHAGDMQRDIDKFMSQSGYLNNTLLVAKFVCELFPESAGEHLAIVEQRLRDLTPAPAFYPEATESEIPDANVAMEEPSEALPTVSIIPEEQRVIPEGPKFQTILPEKEKYAEDMLFPAMQKTGKRTGTRPWLVPVVIIGLIGLGLGVFTLKNKYGGKATGTKETTTANASQPKVSSKEPKVFAELEKPGKEDGGQWDTTPRPEPSLQPTSGEKPILTKETQEPEINQNLRAEPVTSKIEPKKTEPEQVPPPITETLPKTPRTSEIKPSQPSEEGLSKVSEEQPQDTAKESPTIESQPITTPRAKTEENSKPSSISPEVSAETPGKVTEPEPSTTKPEAPIVTPGNGETQARSTLPPPEPSLPKPGDLIENPDTPPKELVRASITLPLIARQSRWSDLVILRVLIDENGRAVKVNVLRSKYQPLADAATQSALKSTYSSATHKGVKVKAWLTLTYNFKP